MTTYFFLKVAFLITIFLFTLLVYFNISFTKSTSKFWRHTYKSGGGGLLIERTNFNAGFVKPTLYNIFWGQQKLYSKQTRKVVNSNFYIIQMLKIIL
jgi:hypothetical protein